MRRSRKCQFDTYSGLDNYDPRVFDDRNPEIQFNSQDTLPPVNPKAEPTIQIRVIALSVVCFLKNLYRGYK